MTTRATTEDGWVCQCRKCWGVHSGADAVQYAWEWCLAGCGVDTVVGLCVSADGHVWCAPTYWHDEPVDYDRWSGDQNYLVSFRPGAGTAPTEGDIARWAHWLETGSPDDWLIADGTRFRSVRDTYETLHARGPIPGEHEILGDWEEPSASFLEFRRETKSDWAQIKARNARMWTT